METESVWSKGVHIDSRWHVFESIHGEDVLYSDTKFFRDFDDPPHGDLRVEEISLRWKDGSITRIQMERPPAKVDANLEPRELDPFSVDGHADSFYRTVQSMFQQLFNGDKSAGVVVKTDREGALYFDELEEAEAEQSQGPEQNPKP